MIPGGSGCSGLELAQTLLGQRWQSPGVRKFAEETLITAARLVRAFANLDRNFAGSAAGTRAESVRPVIPAPPPVPERPAGRRELRREPERSRDRTRRRREPSKQRDERPPLQGRKRLRSCTPRGARSLQIDARKKTKTARRAKRGQLKKTVR